LVGGGGLGGGGGGGRESKRAISLVVNDGFGSSGIYDNGAEVRCNFSNSSICINASSSLLTA
jgi:hypothetical protein